MSSEHTKGPWKVNRHTHIRGELWLSILGGAWDITHNGASRPGVIADAKYSAMSDAENEANARRIVACVNACEGLPTETLEAAGLGKGVLDHLKAERDALREQIAFLEHFADAPDMKTGKNTRDILRSQNAELVEALNELLYGTDCYLDTESRSVFHFTTEQLAQARSALAKAKP